MCCRFAPNQRDIATTIGSLFNPLGNALGQIFPVIFVTQDDEGGPVKGMEVLLGGFCEPTVASFLCQRAVY